jgi:hypothetical protein
MPIKAPIRGISSIVYPITSISFFKSTIFGKNSATSAYLKSILPLNVGTEHYFLTLPQELKIL